MYYKIESNEQLKGRVKLVGIGAGNTMFEVGQFRKTYTIPFPLFPDGDFSIHKKIGEVRTPYFIGVRIQADGSHEIYFSSLWRARDSSRLLETLLQNSRLE